MTTLQFYIPISKVDKSQRMVYGYASTPTKDLQGEVVELEAIKSALPDYMEWRNIREMHQPSAVGVTKEANIDDKGLYIGAKIVDDTAWKKVEEEVYKGFSIGGERLAKVGDTITKLRLTEISLVDRPANPDCKIEVFKAAAPVANCGVELTKVADGSLTENERNFVDRLFDRLENLVGKRKFSAEHRQEAADKGHAMPDGSFPIENKKDLQNAIHAIGRAKNPEAAKEHIKRRAKELGAEDLLPEDWKKSVESSSLRKDMDVIHILANAFDALRQAQRSLLVEARQEGGDQDDLKIADSLGTLAEQVAGLMSEKAMEEGEEAVSLDDAADSWVNQFVQPTEAESKMADTDELKKRAAGAKASLNKCASHMGKVAAHLTKGMDSFRKAHGMFGKSDGFNTAECKGHLDKAAEHFEAAQEHHDMAGEHLGKAMKTVLAENDGDIDGSGTISDVNVKGAIEQAMEKVSAQVKELTEALAKKAEEAAYLKGKAEALEKQPAAGPRVRTFAVDKALLPGMEGEADPSALLLEGIRPGDMNDPAYAKDVTARVIGNMIAHGDKFGKNVLTDPNFRGAAGKRNH